MANQSAMPPTSEASAVARMYPTQLCWGSNTLATTKMAPMSTSSPVARRFIRSRLRWRSSGLVRSCIAVMLEEYALLSCSQCLDALLDGGLQARSSLDQPRSLQE